MTWPLADLASMGNWLSGQLDDADADAQSNWPGAKK